MFSVARLKPLFSYGWKMAISGLLDSFFRQLAGLLIGKFYTRADLAYVHKGHALPSLAMNEVDGTLGRVSFPALVQLQDDKIKLRDAMRRMMMCSTFLVFPLMVGVAASAKSELLLLYGEQWVPATPYMMLACFTFALWPFHTINLKGIVALGRSDIFLKLEIIKKTLSLLIIFGFLRFGVLPYMIASAFAMGVLGVLINSWPNRKLLNYPIRMQIMDVFPTVLVCVAEAAVVFGIDLGVDTIIQSSGPKVQGGWRQSVYLAIKLLLQFVLGAGTFFGLSYFFKLKPMGEYVRMMPLAIKRRMPGLIGLIERRFAI